MSDELQSVRAVEFAESVLLGEHESLCCCGGQARAGAASVRRPGLSLEPRMASYSQSAELAIRAVTDQWPTAPSDALAVCVFRLVANRTICATRRARWTVSVLIR